MKSGMATVTNWRVESTAKIEKLMMRGTSGLESTFLVLWGVPDAWDFRKVPINKYCLFN